jgi:hypothetical protein
MMTGEIVLMGPSLGVEDSSKTALGILLIAALGIGAFGVATARLSHRAPGHSARPWAKKGVFRGLGRAAIQLWGGKRSRRRRR